MMARGAFCTLCHAWTWVQADEDPEEFVDPERCGSCGEPVPVDLLGEYTLFITDPVQ